MFCGSVRRKHCSRFGLYLTYSKVEPCHMFHTVIIISSISERHNSCEKTGKQRTSKFSLCTHVIHQHTATQQGISVEISLWWLLTRWTNDKLALSQKNCLWTGPNTNNLPYPFSYFPPTFLSLSFVFSPFWLHCLSCHNNNTEAQLFFPSELVLAVSISAISMICVKEFDSKWRL